MKGYAHIFDNDAAFEELLHKSTTLEHGNNYVVTRLDVSFNTSTDKFEFETICVNEYGGVYGNEDLNVGFLSRLSWEAYSELLRYAR